MHLAHVYDTTLASTDSSSALLSDRPPSKTSLITPRRERLKGSDSSSPKSSAQQLIENEPAKFRAAVEAKEYAYCWCTVMYLRNRRRERQAKDAGDAEMPLIEYENGDTYQGELNAQGERHGRGVYTNNRGDVYSGEYKNGKKHGKGVFSRADGSRYEVWIYSMFHSSESIYRASSRQVCSTATVCTFTRMVREECCLRTEPAYS